MRKTQIGVGRFVEFNHFGLRLGRVWRMRGNVLTVILHPYGVRGSRQGKRVRVHVDKLTGILWRKRIIPLR